MKSILVIDDDKSLINLLSLIFRSEGLDVTTASNGQEALDCLDNAKPDVIVVDLSMPIMDGREFYHRAREEGYDKPVLILSANNPEQARQELGADAAMRKPFEPEILVEAVESLLEDVKA